MKHGLPWFFRQVRSRAWTLLLVSFFLFVLFRILPGNAQQIAALGQPGAPAASEPADSSGGAARSARDFLVWLGATLRLDFGTSTRNDLPVLQVIGDHLAVSLILATAALLLFYVVAVPLGVLAGALADRPAGRAFNYVFGVLYSLPSFWVALLLMMFLCGGDYLALFPVTGLNSVDDLPRNMWAVLADRMWHLVLPVICISYGGIGYVARQVQSATTECLGADFLLAARAKGLSRFVILRRHVLPHALLPVVALTAQFFPALFAGSVVVETVFSLPGMGRLTLDSVLARDYPVLLAVGLLSAAASLSGGFLVEWLLRLWQPRWEGE
jgi:peptide/nickel transport system permease protein